MAAGPGDVLARKVQGDKLGGGGELLILLAGFGRDHKTYASVVVFIWSRSLKNTQKRNTVWQQALVLLEL